MEEINVNQLARDLIKDKKNNKPKPIFFLGAGASFTGKIPTSEGVIKYVIENYSYMTKIKELKKDERDYFKVMELLEPFQIKEIFKKFVNISNINLTHYYLGNIFKNDYVDFILTVNFDNLILKSLVLYNLYPPVYDIANLDIKILKRYINQTFEKRSIIYLHGQYQSLNLINKISDMDEIKEQIQILFQNIYQRPWIIIGYSGNDYIFDNLLKIGRFTNGLYWVSDKKKPNEKVLKLSTNYVDSGVYFINNIDSDTFMFELNYQLELLERKI